MGNVTVSLLLPYPPWLFSDCNPAYSNGGICRKHNISLFRLVRINSKVMWSNILRRGCVCCVHGIPGVAERNGKRQFRSPLSCGKRNAFCSPLVKGGQGGAIAQSQQGQHEATFTLPISYRSTYRPVAVDTGWYNASGVKIVSLSKATAYNASSVGFTVHWITIGI